MNTRNWSGARRGMFAGVPVLVLGALLLTGCPTTTTVPDVVGLQLEQARAAILSAGLTVGTVTEEADPTAADGEVLAQDPEGGELAAVGWPVNLVVAGEGSSDYEQGFDDGFAEDDWYYEGYYDSLETLEYGPILYEGDEIPAPTSPEYDRGYWDGVWTAYNDGYFTAYDDAFMEGFEDGYNDAYAEDYEEFLLNDVHIEYGTGGYDDGYNDGYSEGRVFGAYDWIDFFGPDWEDALDDYRAGTDLCVVGVCTGDDGPVVLYEWGTNPALISGAKRLERSDAPSIRKPDSSKVSRRVNK